MTAPARAGRSRPEPARGRPARWPGRHHHCSAVASSRHALRRNRHAPAAARPAVRGQRHRMARHAARYPARPRRPKNHGGIAGSAHTGAARCSMPPVVAPPPRVLLPPDRCTWARAAGARVRESLRPAPRRPLPQRDSAAIARSARAAADPAVAALTFATTKFGSDGTNRSAAAACAAAATADRNKTINIPAGPLITHLQPESTPRTHPGHRRLAGWSGR